MEIMLSGFSYINILVKQFKREEIMDKEKIKSFGVNIHPPMGFTIFKILETMCSLPNNESITQEQVIKIINKGKKIDAPHYIGGEEFKMLIGQGYLHYWIPNEELKNLQDYQKPLIATPKAFELVEARRNRVLANESVKVANKSVVIALLVGVVAAALSAMSLMYQIFQKPSAVLIAGITMAIILPFFIYLSLQKFD